MKLRILFFLLFSITALGQTVNPSGTANTVTDFKGGIKATKTISMPKGDHAALYPNVDSLARIQIFAADSTLEYHNGQAWKTVATKDSLDNLASLTQPGIVNYAAVIRYNGTSGLWEYVDDATHKRVGFTTISNMTGDYNAQLVHTNTDFVAGNATTTDETYIKHGLQSGASVDNNYINIRVTRDYMQAKFACTSGTFAHVANANEIYLSSQFTFGFFNPATGEQTVNHIPLVFTNPLAPIVAWATDSSPYTPVITERTATYFRVKFVNSSGTAILTKDNNMKFEILRVGSHIIPNANLAITQSNIWVMATFWNDAPASSGGTPVTPTYVETVTGTAVDNSDPKNPVVNAVTGVTGTAGVTVANGNTAPVIGLGNITPTSVAASGTVAGSNLSGTNTGDNSVNTNSNGYTDTVAATKQDALVSGTNIKTINGNSLLGSGDLVISGGGGGGATNLSYTASPTGVTINSDTGTDADVPPADTTNAGWLLPGDKVKLNNTTGNNSGDNVQATSSVLGITRLYTTTGTNTNGGVDQNTFTNMLAAKLNLSGGTLTGTLNSQSIIPTGSTVYNIGSNTMYFAEGYISGLNTNKIRGVGAANLDVAVNSNTTYARWFGPTGNLALQNAGTYTDNGRRLQVGGQASVSDAPTSATDVIRLTDLGVTNSTTTALSSATLNSTYPNVIVNYEVNCPNITGGGIIYKKATEAGTSDVWQVITAPIAP